MEQPEGTGSGTGAAPEPAAWTPRRRLRLSGSGGALIVVVAVAFVLAIRVFVAGHRPLSWAAAAVVVAVILDPIVDVLAERIRRVPAVLLCCLLAGGAAVSVAYLAFNDLDQAVERLQDTAPEAAANVEDRSDGVGELARDIDLTARVEDAVAGLEERVGGGGEVIRTTALSAPAYLVGVILVVFLLSYGPAIGTAAIEQLPRDRQERTAEVLTRATDRARTAGLLVLANAIVVGAIAGLAADLLGLPAAAVLGLVAGAFSVLPHVGVVLGAVPVVLLTLGLESAAGAAIVGLGAVGLQVVDSFVVRPRVNAAVKIGLLVPFVVIVLAYSIYGVGGAVYGLAYAVFGLAILDELSVDDPAATGHLPGALAVPTES